MNSFIEKFYWFAFLCGDSYINASKYIINFALKSTDSDYVYKLASKIGFDKNRVFYKKQFDKRTNKFYDSMQILFVCKPMVQDLLLLGIFGSHSPEKNIPPIVRFLIEYAKNMDVSDWRYTNIGRIVFGWLLGFYDAEGKFIKPKSGIVTQGGKNDAGKILLEQIKYYFDVQNSVRDVRYNDSTNYVLNIDPDTFIIMMQVYRDSIFRKRCDLGYLDRSF